MVLKFNYLSDGKGKFAPKWLGPFIVVEVLSNGAYHIATLDGHEFFNFINS